MLTSSPRHSPGHEPSAVVHHSGPGGGPLPLTHLARGCVLLG